MPEPRRYVVIGAGAVGGVVGARLHSIRRADLEVLLVARGAHLAAIRAQGLLLRTPDGEVRVHPPVAASPADVDWRDGDVVLLAVKAQQTVAALVDLAAHAPEDTPVVSLQNGVANEREALRWFSEVHGVCVVLPGEHLEPGVVVQQSHPVAGILDVGRVAPTTAASTVTGTEHDFAADVTAAGFLSVVRPDVMAWKHRKLVSNLANAVDAVFHRGPAADRVRELAQEEGERVLARAGIPVATREQDRERRADHLRLGGGERGGSSTWQSVARGTGEAETDHLNGEIVLLARLNGIEAPVNAALQRAVRVLVADGGEPRSVDAEELLTALDLEPAAP